MCKQSKEEIALKQEKASTCIHIAIFSAFLVILFTTFAKRWTQELARSYDENTITPSDYVLYLQIDPEQSQEFDEFYEKEIEKEQRKRDEEDHNDDDVNQEERGRSSRSRGALLMQWLRQNVDLFSQDAAVKILRVDLAFDNKDMLK